MIRVVVVDDHTVVRSGLVALLSDAEGIEVVGTAGNGEEGVERVGELLPDVVMMDLSMPVVDGVEATRRIAAAHPEVRILVVTSFGEQRRVIDAIGAGATGYVLKDIDPALLVDAVRAVASGDVPLDPRVASALISATRGGPAEDLSDREREVLALVGAGRPNKQIARELGIAEATVKAHLTQIYRTIGVADRTQAALWAERNGLTVTDA